MTLFVESRRQGTSPQTIRFYQTFLTPFLRKYTLTPQGIRTFLANLRCGNAKHAYYRAVRASCNWAVKEGYLADNPIKNVEVPKITRRILPSLSMEQRPTAIVRLRSRMAERNVPRLEPDPNQAGVVVSIFKGVIEGKRRKEIIKELNHSGIAAPRGNSWGRPQYTRFSLSH